MKGIIDISPAFKPGDPMPDGYIARAEWATIQLKAGLRQRVCGYCSRWFFPQELSGEEIEGTARTSSGKKVTQIFALCKECKTKQDSRKLNQ